MLQLVLLILEQTLKNNVDLFKFILFYLFSDVDTPEIDEKSLITYISSMYDVFQEPPSYHPFADEVSINFFFFS